MQRVLTDLSLEGNKLIDFRADPRTSPPTNPEDGSIYFDETLVQYRGWDGSQWVTLNYVLPTGLQLLAPAIASVAGHADEVIFVNSAATGFELRHLSDYLETILPDLNDISVYVESIPGENVIKDINHNLGTTNLVFTCYNTAGEVYIPGKATTINANTLRLENNPPVSGKIVIIGITP